MQHPLIDRARELAYKAHEGQVRPNSAKDLKTLHLAEVASLVDCYGGTLEECVAAWLHDILEDTTVIKEEITREFGEDIGRTVIGLTDKSFGSTTDILARKCIQAVRIASESNAVKMVKMADQISNVRSVHFDPPIEWTTKDCIAYIDGARIVVEKCKEANWELYSCFLITYQEALEYYYNGK